MHRPPAPFLRSGLAVLALACGGPAAAQDPGPDAVEGMVDDTGADAGLMLDAIVVTAPTAAGAANGGGNASIVGREDLLGAFQGAGLPTVLNSIPGVTTETTPGDPAVAVNIRGLQGNGRVVVTIDGARQNFAKSDHGPNGTFVADPEMLRSVEVVRGPAGSDAATGAIGGTLALRTVEAADLIAAGATQGGEARLRYGNLTEGPTAHLAYARRLGEASDFLVAFTRADASNYRAGDGTEVQAAETDLSGLGKFSFATDDGQLVTLSYSQIDSSFRTGTTEGIPRDNDLRTGNAVLNYAYDGGGPLIGDLTLYHTVTDVDQQLLDDIDPRPVGPSRSYRTVTDGLRGSAETGFALGATDHALTFVLDVFGDEVTVDDPTALGGSLTPSGNRRVGSFLVQDAIGLTETFEAIVGLRADDYRLSSDDGDSSGAQLSPSLTLRKIIGDTATVYATLAKAFRPPTLSETLVNGMHPEPADFYIRPNPELKPESSLTSEIGVTLAFADLLRPGDTLTAQGAIYRNDVKDYIGLVQRGTLFDSYMQYDNMEEVRIEGIELEVAYDADRLFGSLSGQIIEGTDLVTDEPVSGIAPNRLVLTGGVRDASETLEIGARLTLTGEREDGVLTSDAWQTIDLFVTQQLGAYGVLGLALNNITDQTYTQYLNTQPSPGFNALASLSIVF